MPQLTKWLAEADFREFKVFFFDTNTVFQLLLITKRPKITQGFDSKMLSCLTVFEEMIMKISLTNSTNCWLVLFALPMVTLLSVLFEEFR